MSGSMRLFVFLVRSPGLNLEVPGLSPSLTIIWGCFVIDSSSTSLPTGLPPASSCWDS